MEYSRIDFWRFALALAIIAAPAAILEARNNDRWAWRYVALILVMLIVTQYHGIEAFAAFVRRELTNKGS